MTQADQEYQIAFLESHPDAIVKVSCESGDAESKDTIILSPVLELQHKVLAKDDLAFLIVYGNHGGSSKMKWSPIYKSEIKFTKSETAPYKYEFNEFTMQMIDLA